MAILFYGNDLTFIHIPKCAGTSVAEWAKSVPDSKNQIKHAKMSRVAKIWPEHGMFFTIVRNPWDRAVSLYHYVGQLANGQIPCRVRYKQFQIWQELYTAGLCAFLQALKRQDHNVDVQDRNWQIWEPQSAWLDGDHECIILRYENLPHDFRQIQDLVGCHEDLLRENASQHDDYVTYYDKESTKLVADIWATDIEKFGYSAP